MDKNILVVNIGSSSKKYSLFSSGTLVLSAYFERDKDTFAVTYQKEEASLISFEMFTESLFTFCDTLQKRGVLIGEEIVIGLRLVAPGEYFTEDRIVDSEFLEKLAIVAQQDVAHIEPVQKELARMKELFKNSKIIAISDSAFHKTIPKIAKEYSLPEVLRHEEGLSRYGYHGISLSYITRTLASRPWGLEKKAIICHLGSGASITAVKDGKSIETSMGYSPLSGLVMSSRIGDIDAGAILHLLEKKSVEELETLFYKESGLLGISGLSDDMRVLIDAEKEGHLGAHLAIESFVYTLQKYIGMYTSVLGGVDLIVFSGTIGERSFILRERICNTLGWLSVSLDSEKNKHAKTGDYINKEGSVGVCVIHSDEDLEIAKKVQTFV